MNNVKINKELLINSLFWRFLERMFSQGVNLVVQILLARLLLPSDFAELAIIAAIINYASIFVQSGIATVIIQKKDVDELDISTLLVASLAIAGFFYFLIYCFAPRISIFYSFPALKTGLRVLSLVLFLNAINSIQTAVLTKAMLFRKLFIRTSIAVITSGISGIILAYYGYGIWALIVHNLVNMSVLVGLLLFSPEYTMSFKFSMDRFKNLYSFCIKLLGAGLISGFHDTIRTMIIGKKFSSNELAYYDKAYSYSMYASSIINSSISSVLLPTFAFNQDNHNRLLDLTRKAVRLSALVTFPFLFGICAMSEPLVSFLLTDKWLGCVPFLMIFCILRLPGTIISVDRQVYYALGNATIDLIYESCLLVCNIVSIIITIPYGPFAIAIGATVVEYLGFLAICIVSRKTYEYTYKMRIADVFPFFFSAAITAMIILYIKKFDLPVFCLMLLQIGAGLVIYYFLIKLVAKETLEYFLSTIKSTIRKYF